MKQQMAVDVLPSLTALRVVAALFVVLHHTREAWAHFPVINAMAQMGWLGVSYFFILSGFVLMWGFDPALPEGRFILRRLVRIYPLHLACLLASMLAFLVFHRPLGGYIGTLWGTLANVFLIQDWFSSRPEIRQSWNGVSWTLSCELLFYVAAPVLFKRMLAMGLAGRQLCVVGILWCICLGLGLIGTALYKDAVLDFLIYNPIPRFLEFVLGAIGAQFMRAGWRLRSRLLPVALAIVPLIIYGLCVPDAPYYMSNPVMISLFIPGAFLCVVSMASRDMEGGTSWTQNAVLVFLGESSYALYMTHPLLLGVFSMMRKALLPAASVLPLWGEVLTVLFMICALGVSVIVHIGFEKPVRVWLMQKLNRSPIVSVPI